MRTIADVREKLPQFSHLSDDAVARALYKKYGDGKEAGQFMQEIGYAPSDESYAPLSAGVDTLQAGLQSSVAGGLGALGLGDAEAWEQAAEANRFRAAQQTAGAVSPDEWLSKPLTFAYENLAQSVPVSGPALAGGIAGGLTLGPLGAIGGALVGGGSTYYGLNRERQKEENEGKVQSEGAALGTGLAQGGLDAALGLLTGGTGKALIKTALATGTGARAIQALKGAFLGAGIEVPTELVQTALERYQAGLSIDPTDPEARAEYEAAAKGALVLGGGFGAVEGAVETPRKKPGPESDETTPEAEAEPEAPAPTQVDVDPLSDPETAKEFLAAQGIPAAANLDDDQAVSAALARGQALNTEIERDNQRLETKAALRAALPDVLADARFYEPFSIREFAAKTGVTDTNTVSQFLTELAKDKTSPFQKAKGSKFLIRTGAPSSVAPKAPDAAVAQGQDADAAEPADAGQALTPAKRVIDPAAPQTGDPFAAMKAARQQNEMRYHLGEIDPEQPSPYNKVREVASQLPEAANIDAHGIATGYDPEEQLANLLTKGIDPKRPFHSGPLGRASDGTIRSVGLGVKDEAPYLLLARPGQSLKKDGVGAVLVNDAAEVNLPALQQQFPKTTFLRADDLPAWIGDVNTTPVSRETQLADANVKNRIKAWHGSPHKFDKFSLQHIGSGEGTPTEVSYGHGLYFGERKGTGEWYRNNLTGMAGLNKLPWKVVLDGQEINRDDSTSNPIYDNIEWAVNEADGDRDAAIKILKDALTENPNWNKEDLGDWETSIALLEGDPSRTEIARREKPGALYEVSIDADKDKLLDWDAPRNKQPEHVQKALKSVGFGDPEWVANSNANEFFFRDGKETKGFITYNPDTGAYYARVGEPGRSSLIDATKSIEEAKASIEAETLAKTGKDIYRELSKKLGGDEKASAVLREAGVPGLKYVDGWTRKKDPSEQTRNFVMFDDSLVNIDARYRKEMAENAKKVDRLEKAVSRLAKRLAPDAKFMADENIMGGLSVGQYRNHPAIGQMIRVSLTKADPLETLRHEAIHYLRDSGIISERDWSKLAKEAQAQDWIGRYDIEKHYAGLSPDAKLEEAVAEHFAAGFNSRFKGWPGWMQALAQRIRQFFRLLKADVNRIFGKDATANDIMARIEAGRLGVRKGLGGVGFVAPAFAMERIKAWHGSPHRFDKFSLQHIGTGEGAQAYGHGLYFAEKRGTAEWYRDTLSPESEETTLIDGESIYDNDGAVRSPWMQVADWVVRLSNGDVSKAADLLERTMGRSPPESGYTTEDYATALSTLRNTPERVRLGKTRGALYELSLDADHDQLLDWDAPLSKQPEPVRKAIEELGVSAGEWVPSQSRGEDEQSYRSGTNSLGWISKTTQGNYVARIFEGRGSRELDRFSSIDEAKRAIESEAATGKQIYQILSGKTGGPEKASEALKNAGIPGLRYLDGGSRGAGDGTRNFVMFDDRLVNIDARYRKAAIASKDPDQAKIDASMARVLSKRPTVREKFIAAFAAPEPNWNVIDRLKTAAVDKAHRLRLNERIVQGATKLAPGADLSDPATRKRAMEAGTRFEADISGVAAADMVSMANGVVASMARDMASPVLAKTKGTGQYDGFVTTKNDPVAKRYYELTKQVYGKGLQGEGALYAAAVRAQKLAKEGRENLLTPTDIANGLLAGDRNPILKQWQQAYQAYNKKLLDFAVSTGVITKEKADLWSKDGDYYPFYRHLEELEKSGQVSSEKGPKTIAGIASAKTVKQLKGDSDPLFDDPLAAQTKNARWWVEAGMKNIAALRNVDTAAQLGFARKMKKGEKANGRNVANVYRDGIHERWEITDAPTFEALTALGAPDLGFWGKLLSIPADLLRATVTSMPDFIVANMLRDTPQAWALTRGFNPVNVVKGFANALRNQGSAQALRRAGVSGGFDLNRADSFESADIIKNKLGIGTKVHQVRTPAEAWEVLKRGWGKWQEVSEGSDLATRSAIYDAALKETGNEAEAAYRALDYLNFSRHGAAKGMRTLTAMIPFLNARIQGLESLYGKGIKPGARVLLSPLGISRKPNPEEKRQGRMMLAKGMTLALIAIAANEYMKDDEDYQQADDYLKDANILLPAEWFGMEKGLVAIPKPFELGALFQTLPVRILEAARGELGADRDLLDSIVNMAFNTFKVNPIPQAMLPALEVVGYPTFTGQPVVPRNLESLRPEDQYTDKTSDLAKGFGQLTGIAPVKVDHILKGYFGTLGRYMLAATDYALKDASDPASNAIIENEFSRRFLKLPESTGSKQLSEFYELRTELNQTMRSFKQRLQEGRIEDARELVQENLPLLAQRSAITAIDNGLQSIRKQMIAVRNSPLPPERKRELLDRLAQIRQSIVARTVPNIREATLAQ